MKRAREEPTDGGGDAELANGNHSQPGEESHEGKAYVPGVSRALKSSEVLVCDKNAYQFLRDFECDYPCLSFDPVEDGLGEKRDGFPVTVTLVSGTQADKSRNNSINLIRLANLKKRAQTEEDESSESESEDEGDGHGGGGGKPMMLSAKIPHHGGINRIRATNILSASLCACWNSEGKVQIWNLANGLKALNEAEEDGGKKPHTTLKTEKPLFSFPGHNSEGFALDWSSQSHGKLASGDNRGRIHLWSMGEGGHWAVDQRPLADHKDSVEDIQWSPTEDNVFSSCSADGSIRLWDGRMKPGEACVCVVETAHASDVNVISWNRKDPFLLSGGDDAAVKVWDLKTIQYKTPVATFKHHTKPITSVHWNPFDSSCFSASSEDDTLTIWDLAIEADEVMETEGQGDEGKVPAQLLFVHAGQSQIKEVRWHPQAVGVLTSTAEDGFNIFRTINL